VALSFQLVTQFCACSVNATFTVRAKLQSLKTRKPQNKFSGNFVSCWVY